MLPTAGSDMLYTVQPVDILRKAKVIVAPAKATAAGGVMHCLTALTTIHMSWCEMIVEQFCSHFSCLSLLHFSLV